MGVGNQLNGVILLKYDEVITYIFIYTYWYFLIHIISESHFRMKFKNIKAHFMTDAELEVCTKGEIFRGNGATFTIHCHHKYVIHATGVISNSHLKRSNL